MKEISRHTYNKDKKVHIHAAAAAAFQHTCTFSVSFLSSDVQDVIFYINKSD